MFVRVWSYQVTPEVADDFERHYGAEGSWAVLFSSHDGHLGTELFRGVDTPGRYLTVDRFASEDAWRSFRAAHQVEYDELGVRLAGLTESQQELA